MTTLVADSETLYKLGSKVCFGTSSGSAQYHNALVVFPHNGKTIIAATNGVYAAFCDLCDGEMRCDGMLFFPKEWLNVLKKIKGEVSITEGTEIVMQTGHLTARSRSIRSLDITKIFWDKPETRVCLTQSERKELISLLPSKSSWKKGRTLLKATDDGLSFECSLYDETFESKVSCTTTSPWTTTVGPLLLRRVLSGIKGDVLIESVNSNDIPIRFIGKDVYVYLMPMR